MISGKAFKELLAASNISIRAIAKKTGLSYVTVWKYVNDEEILTRHSTRNKCITAYLQLKENK